MSTGELLNIEPQELQFPFELRKQISCSLQLSNKTDNYVAFKVKTTNPKKYCVRPNNGVVLPRSTSDGLVTMQGQKEVPPDMQCKDKFLLQSVVASLGATAKDITPEMFNKEAGHNVEECRLRVIYVAAPRPPSPVHEGSEEGSSPRASDSVSENENFSAPEFSAAASRAFVEQYEPQDKSTEARALISKLTEEKNAVIQQNHKLQQELAVRMLTPARKRLMRDFKRLQQDPPAGISGTPQDNNIVFWSVVILGPNDTPWDGGIFKLTEDYPNKPPTVRFISRMFHPNIYVDGSICLDILQNQWRPIYDVAAILTSIQAARMFSKNKREYNRKIQEMSWTAD